MSSRAMPDSEPERRAGAAAALTTRDRAQTGYAWGVASLFGENVVAALFDIGQGVFGGHLAGEDGLQIRRDHLVVDLLAAGPELPRLRIRARLQVRLAPLLGGKPPRIPRPSRW